MVLSIVRNFDGVSSIELCGSIDKRDKQMEYVVIGGLEYWEEAFFTISNFSVD